MGPPPPPPRHGSKQRARAGLGGRSRCWKDDPGRGPTDVLVGPRGALADTSMGRACDKNNPLHPGFFASRVVNVRPDAAEG